MIINRAPKTRQSTFANRYVCSWKLAGTKNFRLASSKLLGFYGGNCQNPSPSLMRCIIPSPGNIFLQRDQSGAEALIVAYECRRAKFRKLFELGIKPHSYTALQIFLDKFRGEHPANRYKAVEPEILVTYPEYKELFKTIKASQKEYDLGKRVRHCLTPDHEVLTRAGWVKIDSTYSFDEIAIWNAQDSSITFEQPSSWHRSFYEGPMYHYSGPQYDQLMTPEHRLPRYANKRITETTAEAQATYIWGKLPVTGNYTGHLAVSPNHARLTAALQADGCITSASTARFRFKKARKIERLKALLEIGGYEYQSYTLKGIWNCTVQGFQEIIGQFQEHKVFDSWLLSWPADALDALIEELKYWDGYLKDEPVHKREVYYSTIWQNIEWLDTICRLRNKGTSKFQGECHQLGINRRKYAELLPPTIQQYCGEIICPTVSTGYFLVRRNGKISITGNSKNYKMGPRTFQINCLEATEGAVNLTYKQSKEFLSIDDEIFPEILEWHSEIKNSLLNGRTLRNLFGYPRLFTAIWSEGLLRDACAFVPQSTVGTITNLAFVELDAFIRSKRKPWLLLNNKHDSILLECPDTAEHREEASAIMKKAMELPLKSTKGEHYQMKTELSTGHNWAKWDVELNPEGMKEAA